jgi:hypothetical protein
LDGNLEKAKFMNNSDQFKSRAIKAWKLFTLGVTAGIAGSASAGTFEANFNDGQTPLGSTLYGTAEITANGGVDDSGVLKLTKNLNSQSSAYIIDDLDSFQEVNGFTADFMVRMGGGSAVPADGWSFNFASDLPFGPFGEEGAGSGLTIVFDIYDNGGGEAPALDVKWQGEVIGTTVVPIAELRTGAEFWPVHIQLDPDGSVDVIYNGRVFYENLFVPFYQTTYGGQYGFGARTGGLNENQWIDDISITSTIGQIEIGFVEQPQDVKALSGSSLGFNVVLNDDVDVQSYQWQRQAPGTTTFTDIAGEITTTYQTPVLTTADDGVAYRLAVLTWSGQTFYSSTGTVSIVEWELPAPQVTLDFNNGQPFEAQVFGNTFVDSFGGVNDSGALLLMDPFGNQNGSFVLDDFNDGAAVDALTATFSVKYFQSSEPPADGWSISYASNLPDDVFPLAEEGVGNGLTVAVDMYNSGGGEAPAIDVFWRGQVVASQKVGLGFLAPQDRLLPVVIRLESDGTVDVAYDGVVIHENVALPEFTAIGGGRFGLAARSGGLYAGTLVDDLTLSTSIYAGDISIVSQPVGGTVLVGGTTSFQVEVNDPARATYQWQSKASGDADFSNIAGAVNAIYDTPAAQLSDDGTLYRVVVDAGTSSATSDEVTLSVLDLSRPSAPGQVYTFDDGQDPADSQIFGTAYLDTFSGVGGSGAFILTSAFNDENGAIIFDDANDGQAVDSFTAAFDLYLAGGSNPPADGFSFNYANDLPDSTMGEAENGAGSGLTIAFDIYDNGGGEGPSIDIRWRGQVVASQIVTVDFLRGQQDYDQVLVQLNSNGTVDVAYYGTVIFAGVQLPDFEAIPGGRMGFFGRTGGLNENMWLDNIELQTGLYAGPIEITSQPADQVVTAGSSASFSVQVNDPARATFQWQKKASGDADYSNIAGAQQSSLSITADLADNGSMYRVEVAGPNSSATSDGASLTVVDIALGDPQFSFNFNEGFEPIGTFVLGTAYVDFFGGVDDSGVLKLTTAENSLQGAFFVEEIDPGQTVYGFEVGFKALVGGGTTPPADGFSFNFGNDIPDAVFGEEGNGLGITVAFDIYDNGGGEAPAIDIKYEGNTVASNKSSIDLIRTGDVFVDVILRLENDGTMDVIYNGRVVHYNVQIPGWAGIDGGRVAFGARTGGLNENQFIDDLTISLDTEQAAVQPTVSASLQGENLVIEYTGVLQFAESAAGPFFDITNSSSPYSAPLNEAGQRFFRARNP